MARVNKTRYALLGMLSLGKASGYDIKKKMSNTTNHFWSESDGAIYPILKQLLEEGLVNCEIKNADTGKPKKIYELTDDGLAELQDWLKITPDASPCRDELLLKLFFGNNIDKEVCKSHIENFQREVQSNMEKFKIFDEKFKAAKIDSENLSRYLTLRLGILYAETNLRWSEESLRMLDDV